MSNRSTVVRENRITAAVWQGEALGIQEIPTPILKAQELLVRIELAIGGLNEFGTLVLAGSVSPTSPLRLDPERMVRRWLTVTGVHNYEPRHLLQAVEFLSRTHEFFPWPELVSVVGDLDAIPSVFDTEPSTLRVGVRPSQKDGAAPLRVPD